MKDHVKGNSDSGTSEITFEGLYEMFEGDSADMCNEKFAFTLMGVRAEGLARAERGAKTPMGVSGTFY